jgi:hypothetical protein
MVGHQWWYLLGVDCNVTLTFGKGIVPTFTSSDISKDCNGCG